jgi:WD40 repeat protein
MWESAEGKQVAVLRASDKPISACAVSPDAKQLLSGCLDGLLTHWDLMTHRRLGMFLAHGRPISAIVFASGNDLVATASWDRNVILWDFSRDREGRTLAGHTDIVSGCQFTPNRQLLLSWSHDGTLVLWEVARGQRVATFASHCDRVTAGAISPDGLWAASGARDHVIKLWSLSSRQEVASKDVGAEVRACFFLLDGLSLVAIDVHGRLTLHAVPELEVQDDLATRLAVQCAQLAPCGSQIALGCEDGHLRLVAVENFDSAPLLVTATRTSRPTASKLQRLFGRSRETHAFHCTCPVCRLSFELRGGPPERPTPCPNCNRNLRVSNLALIGQEG